MAADDVASDAGAIFTAVFEKGRDRGDDTASPAPEANPVAEAPPPEVDAKETPEPVPDEPVQGRDSKGRFVPVSELVEERRKLKGERDEEARLRKEAEDRARDYQAKVEAYERRLEQQAKPQPQQQPPEEEIPDPDADPYGHMQWKMQQIERAFQFKALNDNLRWSRQAAVGVVGADIVNEAEQAAVAAGINQRFVNRADPYSDLLGWYKGQKMRSEIGDDLEAYKAKIANETREAVLAELRTQGVPTAATQAAPKKFPGSLASATAAGSVVLDHETPESIFNGAFKRR